MATPPSHPWRRALALLLVCAVLAWLLSVDTLFAWLHQLLDVARPVIAAHPLLGGVLFVLLSALSAMLAFVSSAALVPVAVYSWGATLTAALLWLGWMLGGLCAYALGHAFGRPLLRRMGSARASEFYLERLPAQVDLPVALLVQLALPSEIPGYLFGALRVRLRTYAIALALVEAPFALGTVLLGERVLARQPGWLLALAALALAASLGAVILLRRRLRD